MGRAYVEKIKARPPMPGVLTPGQHEAIKGYIEGIRARVAAARAAVKARRKT